MRMKMLLKKGLTVTLLFALLFTSVDVSSLAIRTVQAAGVSEDSAETENAQYDSGVIFSNSRTDFRDESIYFVMTTRFYDGDPSNNVQCWDGTQYDDADDPEWRGDFKGLAEKLDYIKALGFTAIWITPVVENCSGYDYHGYHAINFSKVDPRYESADFTYQDLIDAVHAKGMKVIQDVVFNHTGNFGEANLMPMFTKEGDLSSPDCLKVIEGSGLPDNYNELLPALQYQARLALMKNTDGVNHDVNNLYHHFGNFNWDDYTSQLAQIAGDCVDLNTENPTVYEYLQDAYSQYIEMGVDGFRVDTTKHISRLTFNNALIEPFYEAAEAAGNNSFYMFGEVCARDRNVWYRNTPALSTPFYTWKESGNYAWSESDWEVNAASCEQHYNDNDDNVSAQPTSNNAFLNGNEYHTPDYSMNSGLGVIDFPMHWNFCQATDAYRVAVGGDQYYNDATWNVTYVDSHDYAPDCAPEGQRFNQSQETWAENLSLMFTFRGIPCIYYGSEVEFMKGAEIDKGPNIAIGETGRAYFGDYIEGSVNVTDFAEYTNATGKMAETLSHPLALHIQRLNKIRQAVPALRKGQYSTEDISGTTMAFKRRYTDSTTDSFALVTVSGSATFSNIPNGTYVDCITGDTRTVTNGTLSASCSGKGNLRVYVLNTSLTPAPGKVGADGKYLYGNSGSVVDPDDPIPSTGQTIYFEKPASWGNSINAYVYGDNASASWPGSSMTLVEGNVYRFVYSGSGSNLKVIFNDGNNQIPASQQPGFDFVKNGYYTINGYQNTVEDSEVAVTGITLNRSSASISVGTTVTLSATVAPANATNKTVTWTSSNPTVATVSGGVVRGVSAGTATITASSSNGKTATAAITVTENTSAVEATGVSLDKESVSLQVGESITLSATVQPANAADQTVTWSSSNSTVATVSGGVVTAKQVGTTTITVRTSNNKTAQAVVTVMGHTGDLTPVFEPVPEGYSVIYFEKPSGWGTAINTYLYYENNGNVTEIAGRWPGTAMEKLSDNIYRYVFKTPASGSAVKILFNDGNNQAPASVGYDFANYGYYTSNGYERTITPTVVVTGISLNKTSASLTVGASVTLSASVTPSNAADRTITWSSSNSAVTTVNNGVVTARAAGTAVITAATQNGKTATATITVTGNELKITGFTANKQSPQAPGSTVRLTVTAEGGQGTLTYKYYRVLDGNTKSYTFKDYSTSATADCAAVTAGTYTLYVDVKDEAGNIATSSMRYTWNTAEELKLTDFTSDLSSPQATWTKIKLTAKAAGGTGSLQYRFYRVSGGVTTVFRDYAVSNEAYCNPGKGTYTLYVDVKDGAGNVVTKSMQFNWGTVEKELTMSSFTSDLVSPQPVWTKIKLSIAAEGGKGELQYRFYRISGGQATVFRDYAASNEAYCNPGKGTYILYGEVKDEDGCIVTRSINFTWGTEAKELTVNSFTSDLVSPQPAWTRIKLSMNASGGTGQLKYRFYRMAGGKLTVFRDYAASNEAYCNPGSGSYTLYGEVCDTSGKVVTKSLSFSWK